MNRVLKQWPKDIKVHLTEDRSPTLAFSRADGYVEKMHHSGGALSESLYIYGHALRLALNKNGPINVASIGLGLGYNELICLAEIMSTKAENWQIVSFEKSDFLREAFLLWLVQPAPPVMKEDKDGEAFMASPDEVYSNLASLIAKHFNLDFLHFKEFALKAYQQGHLIFKEAFPDSLTQSEAHPKRSTVVFYDAFSKKMDPDLWDQAALEHNLQHLCARDCVLTTYAATGSLNRALKALGFQIVDRPGFAGKRESTLAIRSSVDTLKL